MLIGVITCPHAHAVKPEAAKKPKCDFQREKESRYLSNNNIQGRTYQKCGRVGVVQCSSGKWACRQCAAENHIPLP